MLRSLTIATILTAGSIASAAAQYYENPYNRYSGYGPGPGYPNASTQSIGGPEGEDVYRRREPWNQPGCVRRTICVEGKCKQATICP